MEKFKIEDENILQLYQSKIIETLPKELKKIGSDLKKTYPFLKIVLCIDKEYFMEDRFNSESYRELINEFEAYLSSDKRFPYFLRAESPLFKNYLEVGAISTIRKIFYLGIDKKSVLEIDDERKKRKIQDSLDTLIKYADHVRDSGDKLELKVHDKFITPFFRWFSVGFTIEDKIYDLFHIFDPPNGPDQRWIHFPDMSPYHY